MKLIRPVYLDWNQHLCFTIAEFIHAFTILLRRSAVDKYCPYTDDSRTRLILCIVSTNIPQTRTFFPSETKSLISLIPRLNLGVSIPSRLKLKYCHPLSTQQQSCHILGFQRHWLAVVLLHIEKFLSQYVHSCHYSTGNPMEFDKRPRFQS